LISAGATIDTQLIYFGLGNKKVESKLICQVEGGPDYPISLVGYASDVDFRLDKSELNFGDVLFTQTVEKEIVLSNTGKVPCYFSVDLSSLKRPSVIDIHPLTGLIHPEDRQVILLLTSVHYLWRKYLRLH
jgi:hydrocephalus-inducing protein